jgi:hypothetical protein
MSSSLFAQLHCNSLQQPRNVNQSARMLFSECASGRAPINAALIRNYVRSGARVDMHVRSASAQVTPFRGALFNARTHLTFDHYTHTFTSHHNSLSRCVLQHPDGEGMTLLMAAVMMSRPVSSFYCFDCLLV